MPTLQTPTTVVMPLERRRRIAEIVARHEASLVEDDAYAFLFEESPLPISSLIPDRSFYVVSFAKCLAPGLRIGGMVVPAAYRDRCINAIRATGWMAAPVMAEVVSRLVRNGGLEEQARLKRAAAQARTSLAQRVLNEWLPEPARQPGFHLWLPMPAGRTITALVTQAAQAGVTVAPPGTLRSIDPADLGIRLCLGAPATETELEQALLALRGILLQPESISFV
jgi:DNA-binding transcriptional MocR family regulator